MFTCDKCYSTEFADECLFTAICGCLFCYECIAECEGDFEELCEEHRYERYEQEDVDVCYYKRCSCATDVYPCKYYYLGCDFKGSPTELRKHQVNVEAHLSLSVTKQQEQLKEIKETFEKQCSEMEKSLIEKLNNKLESYKEKDTEELNKQKQLLEKYNDDLNKQKRLLEKYKEKLNQQFTTGNKKELGDIEFPHAIHSYTYIWKVEEFSRLQSQHAVGSSAKSPPFYTAPNGYQMRLELYPNGSDPTQGCSHKGTHLGLFLNVMKGDWDGILQWPIKYAATFTLLAQYNRSEHKSFAVNSDRIRGEDIFARPSTESNKGWGIAKLFLIDDLKPMYLVDDCLYVKLDINVN